MSDDRINPTALTLGRLIAAPRSDVFRAWTEPELLARWWWPARFRTTYEVDLRPGGRWRFRTDDLPDLGVLTVGGAFLEVRASERLVYTWVWEEGAAEGETLVTVEFRDRGDQTEVHVTHERFADGRARDEHVQGWADCLERLMHAAGAGDLASDAGERRGMAPPCGTAMRRGAPSSSSIPTTYTSSTRSRSRRRRGGRSGTGGS